MSFNLLSHASKHLSVGFEYIVRKYKNSIAAWWVCSRNPSLTIFGVWYLLICSIATIMNWKCNQVGHQFDKISKPAGFPQEIDIVKIGTITKEKALG